MSAMLNSSRKRQDTCPLFTTTLSLISFFLFTHLL
jgi:hypothetical protein